MAPNLPHKFEVPPLNGIIRSSAARRIGMQSTGIDSGYAAIGPEESDEYLCASIYTLQSHDNPPMIYAVNFLRDVSRARRLLWGPPESRANPRRATAVAKA